MRSVSLDPLREAIRGSRKDGDIDPEAAGLLDGLQDEREREARSELVENLAADGASIEELRDAAARDRLPLLALERALGGEERERYTIAQLAERSGVELDYLRALRRALGLASADPQDERGSDADVEAAKTVQRLRDAGLPDEGLLEIARVLGHGMSLLAATIRRVLAEAYLQPGDTELDAALRYAEAAERLRPELGPILERALAVHQREQIGSEVVGKAQLATGRLEGSADVTVCFADLVGFTELGEDVTPAGLGALAGRLTDLAVDCARPPVQLVKMIGDAALLVSHDCEALVNAALELMDAVDAEPGLPALRIGITRGSAISRGGEWYGTPVNVASKLTAFASAGSVLASAGVREHAGDGFAWSKPRRRRLPGVKGRVQLFEVRLPRASRSEPWPGYDHHTVDEIRERLADGASASPATVRVYERRHKRRKGVFKAADVRERRGR